MYIFVIPPAGIQHQRTIIGEERRKTADQWGTENLSGDRESGEQKIFEKTATSGEQRRNWGLDWLIFLDSKQPFREISGG